MASVFLSYARADAAKAKALAKALENGAHEVWWDRHIQSGSEFAGAIEEALNRADVVLVLWSQASVVSSWVRDEAAEGRDSGRLVPVLIDKCRPPIGFRQFQSMDLSGWNGRGTPKHLSELVRAIDNKGSKQQVVPPASAAVKTPTIRSRRFGTAMVGVVVAALLLFGGWFYSARHSTSAAKTPTLAVLPFADLSPQRDKAYFSEGVAEEILSLLARDPGIRVIGRSSSRQFQGASSDLQGIRNVLGVTHVLEGSARTSGDELRMSVRLIDASDGRQIWAEDYQREMSNIFAIQGEIGRAVAQRLSGSLSKAPKQASQTTAVNTYALYLAARAKMRERTAPALNQALQLAKQVIAADQNYAPGHAIYAELLWLLSEHNYGNLPIDRVLIVAKRHAEQAIKLAPDQAEGYAALGFIPPPEKAIAALRKAISLDPSRSELRIWLAGAYAEAGRNTEALNEHRAAAEMEPIWAPAVRNFSDALAANRRFDEAERTVRQFESRGGASAQGALMRAHIAWMRGDLSEAVRYSQAVLRANPDVFSSSPSQPFVYHDLGLFGYAAKLSRGDLRVRLFVGNKYAELAQLARKEGIWGRPSAALSLDAIALTREWAAIEALYDARPNPAADPCLKSVGAGGAIHVAIALRARGRGNEAGRMMVCARKRVAEHSKDPARNFFYPDSYLAVLSAQIYAYDGNRAAAFREFNRAFSLGFGTPHSSGLAFFPAFDQFRSAPEYRELETRLKSKMLLERRQALEHLPNGTAQ